MTDAADHPGVSSAADPGDRLSYARSLLALAVGASKDSERRIGMVICILAEVEHTLYLGKPA